MYSKPFSTGQIIRNQNDESKFLKLFHDDNEPSLVGPYSSKNLLIRNSAAKKAIFCGDSITAVADSFGATAHAWETDGYPTFVRQFSRGSLDITRDNIFATSGYTTQQWIDTWLDKALKSGADIAFMLIGTNDLSSIPSATTINNLNYIYSRMLAAGIKLVIIPILPRTNNDTSTIRIRKNGVNNWINEFARTEPRVAIAKTRYTLTDATNATGNPKSGVLKADGLHPGTSGAQQIARDALIAAQTLLDISPLTTKFIDAADVYDSVENTRGNLLGNNPLLTGNAGTEGTGITGETADSWAWSCAGTQGTLAAVASKVNRTGDNENGVWQQLAITGIPTTICSYFLAPTTEITSGFVPGEKVYFEMEIDYDANPVGLIQLGVQLQFTTNADAVVFTTRDPVYISTAGYNEYHSDVGSKYIVRSEPWIIPDTVAKLKPRPVISVALGIDCNIVARVANLAIRKQI